VDRLGGTLDDAEMLLDMAEEEGDPGLPPRWPPSSTPSKQTWRTSRRRASFR